MNKSSFELIPLSAIAEINPPKKSLNISDDNEVTFIPMSDATETGRWVNKQTRLYSEVKQGYTYFEEGDVLFAKITPCTENGKGCLAVGLENGIGFGSTEFHVLRANENGNNGFIFQWSVAQHLRQKAAASMSGSAGQQRIPASFFSQYKIPNIPKFEQTQIATILSTIDRAIEQTEAIIAKQQRIKTGLMQDLLSRGIDDQGNIRSEATHEFKDSPLGRIPVEWEVCPLDDVLSQKQYGISVNLDEEPMGIPILRMNNLVDGEVNFSDLKYSKSIEAKSLLLADKDILFNRTNSIDYVGRTAIFREVNFDVPFASYLVRLIPKRETLLPEYLNYWLNDDRNQVRVKRLATIGVQQANINPTNLGTVRIAFPSNIKEQHRIVRIIEQQRQFETEERKYLQKLHSQKTGLMQDLLTGKVRVAGLLAANS